MQPIDEFLEAHRKAMKMTPGDRFWAAAELFDLSCEIAKAGIRHEFPDATDEEVLRILRERLALARRLEQNP